MWFFFFIIICRNEGLVLSSSGTKESSFIRPMGPLINNQTEKSDLQFDRLQPSDRDLSPALRRDFNHFTARVALIDLELWVGLSLFWYLFGFYLSSTNTCCWNFSWWSFSLYDVNQGCFIAHLKLKPNYCWFNSSILQSPGKLSMLLRYL